MYNLSTNSSNSNSTSYPVMQTSQAGARRNPPRARVLLQAAATLGVLGPRRVAPGGRSKRQGARVATAEVSPALSVVRQIARNKRSGVRVRESAGAGAQTDDNARQDRRRLPGEIVSKSGTKNKSNKQREGARRQPGSTQKDVDFSSSAGSRRRQRRRAALDDFAVVRTRRSAGQAYPDRTRNREQEALGPARHHKRFVGTCTGSPVELGRDNFHSIHANLDGCYGLVENVELRGDRARDMFPVGNSTHPFTGVFDNGPFWLGVHLERSRGDAVLFGAVRDAEITLSLNGTRLVTRNGSRAALVGEMQDNNWLGTVQLHDSLFEASGAGTVQVGLVGTTLGAGNRLFVAKVSNTSMQASAVGASDSCQQLAVSSLGLGLLHSDGRQDIFQQIFADNRLQARADNGWAAVAMLGVFAHPHNQGQLWSVQRALYNNSLLAEGGAGMHAGGLPVAGCCTPGGSASLGYADRQSAAPVSAPPKMRLYAEQADWLNNSVQAFTAGNTTLSPAADNRSRTSLVSTAAVDFVLLQQRSLAPGQLRGSPAGRSLLPAAREMALFLFSGGDARLPLFAADTHGSCNLTGLVDTAGFQWASGSDSRACASQLVQVSSLQPPGWREAYKALRYSDSLLPAWILLGHEWDCSRQDTRTGPFHYTGERPQSLTPVAGGWLLLTRQRYPWQQDKDLRGLLRVIPYKGGTFSSLLTIGEDGLESGGPGLYRPHPQDLRLQDARAGDSLVQGHLLHQLYQKPGHPPQLVSLALNETDSYYRLRQYDALTGQARLLSVEDGELHLWMQQEESDSLQVYRLGAAAQVTPANTSSEPRWVFDLSQQPGGVALLAREGAWLYAVRQTGMTASLRRWQLATAAMDSGWQPDWPGQVTPDLRLVLLQGRLVGLATDGVVAPLIPYRLQVPPGGGCVLYVPQVDVPWHSLPPVSEFPATVEPMPSMTPGFPVPPSSPGEEPPRTGLGLPAVPIWADALISLVTGVGLAALAGGLVYSVVMKVRRCQIRRRGLAERRQEEALELDVRHPHERQVSPAPQAGDADSSGASGRDDSPARA